LIRTSYDPEADALFVWFAPEGTKSAKAEEVAPGILLGIEVLDVREPLGVLHQSGGPKAAE
jgi:hypothetical protein